MTPLLVSISVFTTFAPSMLTLSPLVSLNDSAPDLTHDVLAEPSRRNRTDLRNDPAKFHDQWVNSRLFIGRILMWQCNLNGVVLTGQCSTACTDEQS